MMNVASSISLPPETDGVDPSGIWAFLWRMSAWVLSAVGSSILRTDTVCDMAPIRTTYTNGRDGCHSFRRCFKPARHLRRMRARRARGIRPVGRYTCGGLAPLIPNSPDTPLTRFQYLERCSKLAPMGRFQIYNWNYVSAGLRKSAANLAVVYLGLFAAHCAPFCAAPLKPD